MQVGIGNRNSFFLNTVTAITLIYFTLGNILLGLCFHGRHTCPRCYIWFVENVRTPSRPPESHFRDSLKWLTRNVSLRIFRHLSTIVWGFLSFLIFPATKTWNGKSSVMRFCYEAVILLPCWGWVGYESVWNKKRECRRKLHKKSSSWLLEGVGI